MNIHFRIVGLCVLSVLVLMFSTASEAPARVAAEPGALATLNLASDTAWTIRLDEAAPRSVKVPGGGWNSDLQQPPIQVMMDVKDHVLYERQIDMPAAAHGQAVKLRFVYLVMESRRNGQTVFREESTWLNVNTGK